jgi:hypothetical protein
MTGYTRRMKVHTGYELDVSMLILHSLIVYKCEGEIAVGFLTE